VNTDNRDLKTVDMACDFRATHDLDGFVAIFPDRHGGVSSAPFDSLNLGFSTGDKLEDVRENRQRLADSAKVSSEQIIVPGQVHAAEILKPQLSDGGEGFLNPSVPFAGYDVVLLNTPGVLVLSLTADCPLVTLVNPQLRQAGVAHCGWRGVASGALTTLLAEMGPPKDLLAMISPGICGAKYPVGEEVLMAVSGLPGADLACQDGTLDIRAILHETLIDTGLPATSIWSDTRCSASDMNLFSYRRDRGKTGRSGALVGWKY